jgi:L-cysteine S-thiosulfotransferase
MPLSLPFARLRANGVVQRFLRRLPRFILLILLGAAHAVPLSAQSDLRQSGTSFLSKPLQALQNDPDKNPAQLWVMRGQSFWQAQCVSCHAAITTMRTIVATYPKLNAAGKLINLEDHIQEHPVATASSKPNTDEVLALSAALHQAAKGERINALATEPHFTNGQQLYYQRMGRINLACVHCHDQKVGSLMRGDVISQAQPTGFPIYRQSWQTLGTLERRLRACYSGVQAPLPAVGSSDLRDLELFLKVRANGMTIEGPAIRR